MVADQQRDPDDTSADGLSPASFGDSDAWRGDRSEDAPFASSAETGAYPGATADDGHGTAHAEGGHADDDLTVADDLADDDLTADDAGAADDDLTAADDPAAADASQAERDAEAEREAHLTRLFTATVMGPNDERIGKVGQVYLDDQTQEPNWITARTGLFGTKEFFIPLDEATLDGKRINVPYAKDLVTSAPATSIDQNLSPDEEDALYNHYRVPGRMTPEVAAQVEAEQQSAAAHEGVEAGDEAADPTTPAGPADPAFAPFAADAGAPSAGDDSEHPFAAPAEGETDEPRTEANDLGGLFAPPATDATSNGEAPGDDTAGDDHAAWRGGGADAAGASTLDETSDSTTGSAAPLAGHDPWRPAAAQEPRNDGGGWADAETTAFAAPRDSDGAPGTVDAQDPQAPVWPEAEQATARPEDQRPEAERPEAERPGPETGAPADDAPTTALPMPGGRKGGAFPTPEPHPGPSTPGGPGTPDAPTGPTPPGAPITPGEPNGTPEANGEPAPAWPAEPTPAWPAEPTGQPEPTSPFGPTSPSPSGPTESPSPFAPSSWRDAPRDDDTTANGPRWTDALDRVSSEASAPDAPKEPENDTDTGNAPFGLEDLFADDDDDASRGDRSPGGDAPFGRPGA